MRGNARKVLVVFASISGHRLYYARLLAREALDRGFSVALLLPLGARSTNEYATHLGSLTERLHVIEVPLVTYSRIRSIANAEDAHLTIVGDGDLCMTRAALCGWRHGTLHLLLMRMAWGHGAIGRIRGSSKKLISDLLTLRRRIRSFSLVSSTADRVTSAQVRDPIEIERHTTAPVAHAMTESDAFKFGLVGAISGRKNPGLVMGALKRVGGPVALVVAGRVDSQCSKEVRDGVKELQAAGVEVIIRDEVLSDAELNHTIGELDCVVLAHSNEGPSGIFGRAALQGTRILAAGAQSLRRDCLTWPDGALWVPLDPASLAEGMAASVEAGRPPGTHVATPGEFTSLLLNLELNSNVRAGH